MELLAIGLLALLAAALAAPRPLSLGAGPERPPGKGGSLRRRPRCWSRRPGRRSPSTARSSARSSRSAAAWWAAPPPGRVEEYLVNEGERQSRAADRPACAAASFRPSWTPPRRLLRCPAGRAGRAGKVVSGRNRAGPGQARPWPQAELDFRQAKLDARKSLGTSVARELLEEDSSLATQAAASVREAQAACAC